MLVNFCYYLFCLQETFVAIAIFSEVLDIYWMSLRNLWFGKQLEFYFFFLFDLIVK
jgi:hypothetical protein